jgi:hypothetical protein
MGEGMEFLNPKIKPGEVFRSRLPRDDNAAERKRPDVRIVSAHGLNPVSGPETRGSVTARKVEYTVGGATHVLPEVILRGVLERNKYKKRKSGKSQSGVGAVSKKSSSEMGGADIYGLEYEESQVLGRSLLDKLNETDVLLIGSDEYNEDQNLALRLDFVMKKQHLEELVLAYEKKAIDRQDVSRDMQEIVDFSKSILEAFPLEEEENVSIGSERNERGRKPRQKKMRLKENDVAGEKAAGGKKAPKQRRAPKSARGIDGDAQVPAAGNDPASKESSVENGINGENGNLSADFRYLLADGAAAIDTKISSAKNREDISFISFRTLPDGMKEFIEMTEQNGLKKIYKQLIDRGEKTEAFKLKQEWIAENHRLEMSYLKQSLIVEILAVGADTMDRIDKASNSRALQSIGRIVRTKDSEERVFIPTDSGISRNDPSGTEGIRMAIQNMIDAWRGDRVPKRGRWKNFEDYFQREFSSLIGDSNKQIQGFWEEKKATFAKGGRREAPGVAKRGRKERPDSTGVFDLATLERSALQSAEQYFVDEAIPAIEETLRDAGVDLIWLLSDGEYNKSVLDFVLREVGVNIVDIAAGYTGQLPVGERAAFEQKIREAAKNLLVERVMEQISRMLESRPIKEMEV